MQFLKKVISLILVVAMVSSFALVASAEDSKSVLSLHVFDASGQELPAGNQIQVGDTIKVRLTFDDEISVSNFQVYVPYDNTVFDCNESDCTLESVADAFTMKDLHVLVSSRDTLCGVKEGDPAITVALMQYEKAITFPAGTVLAEFVLTAKKATEATEMGLLIEDATRIREDLDFDDIQSEFELKGTTIAVAAAPVSVDSVTISPDSVTLNPNGTQQLTATVAPAEATETVTWRSENEKIATVSDTGLVTAVGVGDTTITATAGGKSGSCTVKVEAAEEDPVTNFEIYGAQDRAIDVGDSVTLQVAMAMRDGSKPPQVNWVSDAPDIVSVAPAKSSNSYTKGKITGNAVGTAHVTASYGSHRVTFNITVSIAVTSLEIDCGGVDFTKPVLAGKSYQLGASVLPIEAAESIIWSSSSPDVASVDQNGLVKALAAGTTSIQVQAGSQTKSVSVTVVDLGVGGYTMAMPKDEKVIPGQPVDIPITIDTAGEDTTFNALDFWIEYVPDELELVTNALDGCDMTDNNGKVHVTRFGENLDVPTQLKLQFNVKATSGTTEIKLYDAVVDIRANANEKNAPNAQILKATTELTIRATHTVSLPRGTNSNQGLSVYDGEDYTFYVIDYDNYHVYTVTATMGTESAEVVDNGDGTYTIKNVTDDVAVSLDVSGKTFNVSLVGQDVTGDSQATYGRDYTFKLTPEDGYTYDITATIDGKPYTGTLAPDAQGNYTIPGDEIKGTVVISVTKKDSTGAATYKVTVEGKGSTAVTAEKIATNGKSFTFTVTEEAGFIYDVEVAIGGMPYANVAVVRSDDGNTATYTIPGEAVTGDILISVGKAASFGVNVNNHDASELKFVGTQGSKVGKIGSDYSFTLNEMKNVYKPVVKITENGTVREASVVTKQVADKRTFTYTVSDVQGDLEIELAWEVDTDVVEIVVEPFVQLNDKTVFLVMTRVKPGYQARLRLDTYDGNYMYNIRSRYLNAFKNPSTSTNSDTYAWLQVVEKGTEFNVDTVLPKLSYTNGLNMPHPETILFSADVNGSGYIDINDAQLVYDIYNGYYTDVQAKIENGTEPVGASMTKFLRADVNEDMKVTVEDAAAIVAELK